jgi:hypothetical protein
MTAPGLRTKGPKVFWFFFSAKNESSFCEQKEAKKLYSVVLYQAAGAVR